jgi:phage replication initiation protein
VAVQPVVELEAKSFPVAVPIHHPANVTKSAVASMLGEADTPLCITGCQSALDTKSDAGGVVVDWLSFTYQTPPIQSQKLISHLKTLLGEDWQGMEKPFYGYGFGARCGNVVILWGGHRDDMGVHVQISGQGCRELEARGLTDWRAWLADRLKEGADFARSDMAFDDFAGRVSIEKITESFKAGLVVSRFNTFQPVAQYDSNGALTGHGFNFGNRSQDTSICCYDKGLQAIRSAQKGKKAAEPSLDAQKALEGSWTRVELRNKNDRAQVLIQRIVREGFAVVAGVLRSYLDFKTPGEASQKCRWSSQEWWLEFCQWAEKTRLKVEGVVKTLQAQMAWVERQAGTILAAVQAVLPDFDGWIADVLHRGSKRFGARHINLMSAYAGVRGNSEGRVDERTPSTLPSGVSMVTG